MKHVLQIKYFYFFSFLLPLSSFSLPLFGTAYHTIVIDGTNDFATDEDFAGTSGSTWYFTWDADNIYIGANNPDISANDNNKWVHLYFDTDPMSPANSGNGSSMGINYNTQQPTLNFSANFHFRWKTNNSFQSLEAYNGSIWTTGNNTGISSFQSGNFVEFKIPRVNLGSPDALYFTSSMINETGGTESTFFRFPTGNSEGYDANYTDWYTYILGNGFSPDAMGNLNRLLPVEFQSVNAITNNKNIKIQFSTSQETNNAYFNIERSTDSRNWKKLGSIAGAGTTQQEQQYSFLDEAPLPGLNYYRIKQVDYDGSFSYSPIVSARWEGKAQVYLFPNPTNDLLQISGLPTTDGPITIEIIDMAGRIMLRHTWNQSAINVASLADGVYSLRISSSIEVIDSQRLFIH
jgi:hypothetical protein